MSAQRHRASWRHGSRAVMQPLALACILEARAHCSAPRARSAPQACIQEARPVRGGQVRLFAPRPPAAGLTHPSFTKGRKDELSSGMPADEQEEQSIRAQPGHPVHTTVRASWRHGQCEIHPQLAASQTHRARRALAAANLEAVCGGRASRMHGCVRASRRHAALLAHRKCTHTTRVHPGGTDCPGVVPVRWCASLLSQPGLSSPEESGIA